MSGPRRIETTTGSDGHVAGGSQDGVHEGRDNAAVCNRHKKWGQREEEGDLLASQALLPLSSEVTVVGPMAMWREGPRTECTAGGTKLLGCVRGGGR